MVSTIDSDPLLHVVLVVTTGFGVLCLLLLITAAGFRLRSERELKEQSATRAYWKDAIASAIAEGPQEAYGLPKLTKKDRARFLEYWCLMHSYVRGSGDDAMNQIAAQLKLSEWVTSLLKSRVLRVRITAVTALGYYGKANSKQLKLIEKMLNHPNSLIAVAALRSLLSLDEQRGAKALEAIFKEKTWSESRVLSALREAPLERVLPSLKLGMKEMPRRTALKCFRLAEQLRGYTDREEALNLLERFLDDTAVVAQFLKLASVPSLLVHATRFLSHRDPEIRGLVIRCIGRLGDASYTPRLFDRLEDEDPWVRFDAAATLIMLPDLTPDAIKAELQKRPASAGSETLTMLIDNQINLQGLAS
ncbi:MULTISPECIES: HEAT repeat domain-containing protein [Gammaproteobacteria]|uniref:HEAT repeat domain-containing protein n=1 Tax=Gammaproteobacteria TaxID=1236 RepID=UPI000DD07004|nr:MULTISPECIES: HEAT repeat domain-containing protein [Gammaproteobacteria]RTE85806.1 HEAT repeat domain-containing protein [Aliidiomarina sp. B3213]TCZ90192.1 HEAT repeat domain-containing protein [Lysobacter sp. N42]